MVCTKQDSISPRLRAAALAAGGRVRVGAGMLELASGEESGLVEAGLSGTAPAALSRYSCVTMPLD